MKLVAATMLALSMAASAYAQTTAPRTEAQSLVITRSGSQPSTQAPAHNFTGSARVDPLFAVEKPGRTSGAYVTFQPGARSAWHTHPAGQLLIVTAGYGRVQNWGGAVEEIRPGDVVWVPPGVKHWHGAALDSALTHIAIQELRDGRSVDWLEKVSDAQYASGPAPRAAAVPAAAPASPPPAREGASQPSRAQQLMGDINPKLAELTDNVLFGDVWGRPGLSRRDRSLVTVSALIAMNRPDQLRSHLALARQNGLTETELIEAITQLAFYAGWPSGVAATTVAREVFQKK